MFVVCCVCIAQPGHDVLWVMARNGPSTAQSPVCSGPFVQDNHNVRPRRGCNYVVLKPWPWE